jgi:hypothetical protein
MNDAQSLDNWIANSETSNADKDGSRTLKNRDPIDTRSIPDFDHLFLPTPMTNDSPFPIASTVCLRCCPSRFYTVLKVEADVDTGDRSPHLSAAPGERQHYYVLGISEGNYVHWWHSQLQPETK